MPPGRSLVWGIGTDLIAPFGLGTDLPVISDWNDYGTDERRRSTIVQGSIPVCQ